ncbi:hypothetical protein GQ44DRAFT_93759 [Phaeosphaeriaceae sp. PMI808]|nr:hypothetical protein GQ44DRAFT_93759 [Phaeosphaeriaceae sp. PMI808]
MEWMGGWLVLGGWIYLFCSVMFKLDRLVVFLEVFFFYLLLCVIVLVMGLVVMLTWFAMSKIVSTILQLWLSG